MWFFLVVYANKNKVFMLCLMKFPLIFMLCFSLFPQGKLKVGLAISNRLLTELTVELSIKELSNIL